MHKEKVLWLITARAGSKGVPDKNVKALAGIPLMAYRIKSALAFANQQDVWVSTDSPVYAEIAQSYGATVPFLRPLELSGDEAKSEDVIIHAMDCAEAQGCEYDAVGLLQPTSPFIKASDLKQAVINLFEDEKADSIVAVREVKPSTRYVQEKDKYLSTIAARIITGGTLRRQDLVTEVTPSGGIFVAKWNFFKEEKTFYSRHALTYLVSGVEGLDIDEPLDWLWAEFLIEKGIIHLNEVFDINKQ